MTDQQAEQLAPWLDRVHCMDARDLLAQLPDGSVDACVTDPPYGIGWTRGTWDDDPEQYAELMRWLVSEANRVTGGGAVFVWQALPNLCRFHEWFPEGFRVFAACNGFVQYRPTPVQWSWDPVVFWGRIPTEGPRMENRDYHVQRLCPFGAGRPGIDHPTPKPEEQVRLIVRLAALQNAVVLDPFLGSGTTAVACVQTGRHFIGSDTNPGYCAIAERRIAEARLQTRMDFSPRPKPRQDGLDL